MKKNAARLALGFVVVLLALAHVANRLPISFIDRLEANIYDTRLRLTMPRTPDSRIVILDINEKSLLEKERGGEGRWPWPRDRLAMLLETLFAHYGVAVVGFDVVFSERDESSGIRVLEHLSGAQLRDVPQFRTALQEIRPQLDYDAIFAQHMKGRAVVLGYAFVGEQTEKGSLPTPVLTGRSGPGGALAAPRFAGYTGNIAVLQKNAAAAGHFNPLPDADGITRRVPMLAEYGGDYYEPLSLAMMRLMYGSPPVKPLVSAGGFSLGYGGVQGLKVGSYRIPVDRHGAALVPYRGPRESFAYYPVVDVLNQRVEQASLQGKIVLVGATAPGMFDLRATPVDPVYPGVEIHANLIAGMLDQSIKQKPPYASGAEFVLVLVAGLLMALWLPDLTPQRATLVTLSVLLLALGINIAFFQYAHVVLPLATVLVTIMLLFTLNMAHGFFVEARQRRHITGLFGQYVPPEVVDEIAKNSQKFSMQGESREMTVLFTDIRGFTTIAEGLEPRALSELMNDFLTPLTEVIHKHRGTIDKYMGDCIMAFWGAPLHDPCHSRNAVLAALEMQRTLKTMQAQFRSKNWPEIRIGVGLNSGRMSVGNMGSRIRLAYTVMGDAVNVASRLEGVTKEYGVDIIVSEETRNAVPDVVFREIDRVRVKGKDAAITIFEPMGLSSDISAEVLEQVRLFENALTHYRNQDWPTARQLLLQLTALDPHTRLYGTFLERIEFLRAQPPGPTWDGAFTFRSK